MVAALASEKLFAVLAGAVEMRMSEFKDIANTALAFAMQGHSNEKMLVEMASAAELVVITFKMLAQ